ncbi:MAG TPA: carboxypeptidase-like regulatory domain-containing protein [Candidatus Dormibacteraeota bacterium]|nr:carboxypeptidase-like regulatory domain-containing protein [Candidatus Dormibacteraeota bacterium]
MPRYCAAFVLGLGLGLILTLGAMAHRQQPVAPVGPVAPIPAAASPSSTAKNDRPGKKHSHANDFLIVGTVFSPQALAYPGAHLQVRRMGESKFRWKTVTNSRGDFAVRVPQGAIYEVVVTGKGFAGQKLTVDALHAADTQQRISIRMESAVGGAK